MLKPPQHIQFNLPFENTFGIASAAEFLLSRTVGLWATCMTRATTSAIFVALTVVMQVRSHRSTEFRE